MTSWAPWYANVSLSRSHTHERLTFSTSTFGSGSCTELKSRSWRWARGPARRSRSVYIWRRTTELPMKSTSFPASRQRASAGPSHLRPHAARDAFRSTRPSCVHRASPNVRRHDCTAGRSWSSSSPRNASHLPAGGGGCAHRWRRSRRPRSDSSTSGASVCRHVACACRAPPSSAAASAWRSRAGTGRASRCPRRSPPSCGRGTSSRARAGTASSAP